MIDKEGNVYYNYSTGGDDIWNGKMIEPSSYK